MQRRFAVLLLLLLVFLLLSLLVGRQVTTRVARVTGRVPAVPTAQPTSAVPPTPIPARQIPVYFESAADERLHAEARDVPLSPDDVALLRVVAAAVLEGPRRADLLRPFPEGWGLRAAYRLKEGLAVLDLAPPALPQNAPPAPPGALRWQTGSHEEESAVQALLVTVTKNIPEITRVVLVVGGEPADTLAGHVDLSHPLRPDLARASEEPPLPAPSPTPVPAATPTPEPPKIPQAAPSPARPVARPARTT